MKKKKLLTVVGGVCVVLILAAVPFMAACAKPAPAPTPAVEPIKIGVILPMTGPLADAGPKAKQGIELRLDEAGSEAGGRPIQLIYEDSQTEGIICLEKAKKLVEADKVHMILGCIELEMCIPYMAEVKVPQIGLRPLVPQPGMELVYNFNPPGAFRMFTCPLGWYAYDKLGYRTAAIITIDRDNGRRHVTAFTEAFEGRGGKVIQAQLPAPDTADFAPYLLALKEADVVVAWNYPPDIARFLTQYNEFGLFEKMPVIIPLCEVLIQEMMPELGDFILGIKGSCDYHWPIDTPLNKKFVGGLKEKYGEELMVDSFTLGGYEAMSVAIATFEATGGDTDSGKLRQAILGLRIETPSTEALTFSPDGWGCKDMHIFELQKVDGQYAWVPIYTYHSVDPMKPVAP